MNHNFIRILVCPVFGTDGLRMADYGYPIRDGFRLDGFLMLHNHSKTMPNFRALHKSARSPLFTIIKAPYYNKHHKCVKFPPKHKTVLNVNLFDIDLGMTPKP